MLIDFLGPAAHKLIHIEWNQRAFYSSYANELFK